MTTPEMIDAAEANIRADHRAGKISKEQFQKEMLIMARARQEAHTHSPQSNVEPQPWKERETFTFDLDEEMVDRLDALAERCEKQGIGVLATANYHGQGQVNVPAAWLRQLIAGFRSSPAPLTIDLNEKATLVAVQNFEDETGGFGESENEKVVRGVISAYLSALTTQGHP